MEESLSYGGPIKPPAVKPWRLRWLLVPLVAFGLLMIINSFYDLGELAYKIDPDNGPNVGVDLVNDTEEPLRFMLCRDERCRSFAAEAGIAPGDTHRVVAEPGEPAWWLVEDGAGSTRGCFYLDVDVADHAMNLFASRLQPCPKWDRPS